MMQLLNAASMVPGLRGTSGDKAATDELIRKQMAALGPQAPQMGVNPPMPQMGPQAPQMGPPQMPQMGGMGGLMGKIGGGIEKFTGNLDKNFASPSKQLGLGLLGQMHPGLALGGLLAGGIFGSR